MKIIKHKVGRPIIYKTTNERLVVRKKQNRINQRRCRLRKQRMKEIQSSTLTNKERNDDYINNILNFFGQYQYNYFFTGTYDPSIEERNERILRNKEINKNNNTFGLDIPFEIENKIGINSLRRYTEKYLQFLFNLNVSRDSEWQKTKSEWAKSAICGFHNVPADLLAIEKASASLGSDTIINSLLKCDAISIQPLQSQFEAFWSYIFNIIAVQTNNTILSNYTIKFKDNIKPLIQNINDSTGNSRNNQTVQNSIV
jgi:hypothetical protein